MNILDIAIAKKLAGGGGGSGTDNYNDLSNLPKINDTTLSGNKSSSALGLQSEINSDSKLASDLVDDTNQDNKFVTSTEKNTWNAKQNAIDSDHKLSSDLVDDANKTNKFVTSTEKNTWNAKQNAIDSDHKLSSDLVDDANKTNKFVTSTEKNTWNAKQNAIDSEHKLSSSLVSFTDAEAAALASGIDSSKVGQISTNQTNILLVQDMVCDDTFSTSKAYAVDDITIYDNKLYKFKNAHQGAWSASDVDQISLSQLEAEDRAALVEVVDKGAKNEFEFGNFTPGGETTSATISDYSVTVTGASSWAKAWRTFRVTKSTAYVLSFRVTNVATVANPQYRVSLGNNHHSGGSYYGIIACDTTGNYDMIFTPPADTDIYLIINPNYTSTAASDTPSITVDNIMICTEEEYKISPAYQPFALPNYDLTQLEQQDRNALAEQIDEGSKNIFDITTPDSLRDTTVIPLENGGAKLSCNNATWTQYHKSIATKTGEKYKVAIYIDSITGSIGSDLGIYVKRENAQDDDPYFELHPTATGVYTADLTALTSVTVISIYINNSGTSKTLDVNMRVMVCTEADWKISQNYAPFALPNSDLTQLEAEDRASLAEVVDEGAKNLFDLQSVTSSQYGTNNATLVFNSDQTNFTVTATSNFGYARILATGLKPNAKYTLSFTVSNRNVDVDGTAILVRNAALSTTLATKEITANGRVDIEFVVPNNDTSVYMAFYASMQSASTINTYTVSDVMVCTKAAFDISPAFVPYRPDYDTLVNGGAAPFFTIPINHNMIYRGKNLGDTLTDAQHTALSGGNFTDLYLGDYWTKTVTIPAFYEVTTAEPSDWSTNYTSYYTKSGDTYTPVSGDTAPTWAANTYYERLVPAQTVTLKAVIADFDTFYAGYASGFAAINSHHAAVVVYGFNNVVWNGTNSTAGGYVNSLIHKWLVGSALPQIETWFGSAKVLSHQKLLTNAIAGDAASGWAWSSQKISLLSENQMYGSKVWGNSKASNGGYEPGEAFKHLNVFNHIDANRLFGNRNIWLRDIASAVGAASLRNGGFAFLDVASEAWIAPAALILLS